MQRVLYIDMAQNRVYIKVSTSENAGKPPHSQVESLYDCFLTQINVCRTQSVSCLLLCDLKEKNNEKFHHHNISLSLRIQDSD